MDVIVSASKVADWSCEETCSWFQFYGFDEPQVIEKLLKFEICARHILTKPITYIELGIVDQAGIELFPYRVDELKERHQQETSMIPMDTKQLGLVHSSIAITGDSTCIALYEAKITKKQFCSIKFNELNTENDDNEEIPDLDLVCT